MILDIGQKVYLALSPPHPPPPPPPAYDLEVKVTEILSKSMHGFTLYLAQL